MSSSIINEINTYKDFEVIWINRITHQLVDLDNVTFEIYHYEEDKPAKIVGNREPYVITQGRNDRLDITVSNGIISFNSNFVLDLHLIITNPESLGCPNNDFVVCGTNNKASIVDGNLVFSLSACELAALINLHASGFIASNENGFIVLNSVGLGSGWTMTVGSGSLNAVIGISQGTTAVGSDLTIQYDVSPQPARHISLGKYAFPNLFLSANTYKVGERYYATFRGHDPVFDRDDVYQEDFTMIDKINKYSGLTYSF